MKVGLLSAYVIYLVIKLLVNLVTASLVIQKKVSMDGGFIQFLNIVETLITLFFTIMIIRLVVKSGFKA